MRDGKETQRKSPLVRIINRHLSEDGTFKATSEKYEVSFMKSQWESVPGKMTCMCSGPGRVLAY